jgi:hypothetical protein
MLVPSYSRSIRIFGKILCEALMMIDYGICDTILYRTFSRWDVNTTIRSYFHPEIIDEVDVDTMDVPEGYIYYTACWRSSTV